jgi:E1A-binding protein p400
MAEVLDRPKGEQIDSSASATSCGNHSPDGVGPVAPNKAALGILESALAAAEDETDVAAARIVRAEAAAEMAEFDESAPLASEDGENNIVDAEINKAEVELQQLEEQVNIYFSLFLFKGNVLTLCFLYSIVDPRRTLRLEVYGEQRGVLEC